MRFDSILVANRGEIACRIIQTAQYMGIKCIAVFVDADRDAPFVKMADEAIRLSSSYMDGSAIIDAAKQTCAQAIHPGYGFLSENAAFARKVKSNKLIWIGPSPHVIKIMGDKLKAKELAEKSGVPSLPMTSDTKDAKNIGYPLLLKAAAGGGGKGMRIVKKQSDLKESIVSAKREALSAFGDDRIFIERYVEKSRHIEIQILGDEHGNIVHLGERECSIQRRHQKIIEEAPAPGIPEKQKLKLASRCADACKKIGYVGAGTFEFLYQNDEFYFIEMNTRLQVEHPVTESITGIDLVQEQIKAAFGTKLSFRQKDIKITGHSIECRINAEDPYDFTPSPGIINRFHLPGGPGVRVDTHAYGGYKIPSHYDSMIGKIITTGSNREQAIAKMRIALSEVVIEGIKTNIPLHIDLMNDLAYKDGGVSIHYLENKFGIKS